MAGQGVGARRRPSPPPVTNQATDTHRQQQSTTPPQDNAEALSYYGERLLADKRDVASAMAAFHRSGACASLLFSVCCFVRGLWLAAMCLYAIP